MRPHGLSAALFAKNCMNEITEDERRELRSWWDDHRDLERGDWESMRTRLSAHSPELLAAWETYKQSMESATMAMEDALEAANI